MIVDNYQGQAGNNFRVYFAEQATENLYGSIAPCRDTTTRPEIDGITCGLSPGPVAPTGLRIVP